MKSMSVEMLLITESLKYLENPCGKGGNASTVTSGDCNISGWVPEQEQFILDLSRSVSLVICGETHQISKESLFAIAHPITRQPTL